MGHRQQGRGSSGEPAPSHTKTFALQGCVCSGCSSLTEDKMGYLQGEAVGCCISQLQRQKPPSLSLVCFHPRWSISGEK